MRLHRVAPALALALLAGCEGGPTTPEPAAGTIAHITDGELDGNAHPAVVMIIMDVAGRPTYSCSGTLLSPRLVLTAGHCTGEPGEFSGLRIFTESDVANGNNNFPFAGPNAIEASEWHSHPEYSNRAFALHDVGVILLAQPRQLPANSYGVLPAVDQLDVLRPGKRTRFTSVGYGVQRINPVKYQDDLVRMRAAPRLVQINVPGFTGDFSLLLSNNASTGGTCFGDSGGPNYLGTSNVIAGVTSFALNGSCGGTGGVFRLDRQNVLDFVRPFLP